MFLNTVVTTNSINCFPCMHLSFYMVKLGYSASSKAAISLGLSGLVFEENRARMVPSRPIGNLLKFQVMRPEKSGFVSEDVR